MKTTDLCLDSFGALLLLLDLQQQRAVDMRQNTSKSDSGANECVEFLVASDGKLKMARCNTLDLEIFGGVSCEFENFSGQIFEDGGEVDARFGADARLLARNGSKMTLYATAGELYWSQDISASSSYAGPSARGAVGQ